MEDLEAAEVADSVDVEEVDLVVGLADAAAAEADEASAEEAAVEGSEEEEASRLSLNLCIVFLL